MITVGAFEAKTHLSALLARVEEGEDVLITKHGKPIARIVPENPSRTRLSVQECIDGLLEFGKSHPMTVSVIQSLVEEGRKY